MKIIKLNREQHRAWRDNAVTARDQLRKELLEQNGGEPFRLMSSNGRFLGTVRHEKSTHTGTASSVKNAMYAPENCLCKQFAGTPPGAHHPICQFKAKWEAQVQYAGAVPAVPGLMPGMGVQHMNAPKPAPVGTGVQHMTVAKQVSLRAPAISTANFAPSVPTVVVTTPPPEQCECRAFTKDPKHDPKQHHVICTHFDRWKLQHPTQEPIETQAVDERDTDTKIPIATATEPPPPDFDFVLVDLNSRTILRDATGEEIESAHAEEVKNGTPFVTIDETMYAVVPRSAMSSSTPNHENHRTTD